MPGGWPEPPQQPQALRPAQGQPEYGGAGNHPPNAEPPLAHSHSDPSVHMHYVPSSEPQPQAWGVDARQTPPPGGDPSVEGIWVDEHGNWIPHEAYMAAKEPDNATPVGNQAQAPAHYIPPAPLHYRAPQAAAAAHHPNHQSAPYHHHADRTRQSSDYRQAYERSDRLPGSVGSLLPPTSLYKEADAVYYRPQVQIFAPQNPAHDHPPQPPPAQGISAGDTMQMLMMNQMMMQQMQAQQMQAAQMAAMTQQSLQGQQGGHGDRGCTKREGGITSVNVKNCQQNARGPRTRRVIRKRVPPQPVVVPVARHPPPPPAPTIAAPAEAGMDNWQEATIILCIAMIGLIYLVITRATNGDSDSGAKKNDPGPARHLVQ